MQDILALLESFVEPGVDVKEFEKRGLDLGALAHAVAILKTFRGKMKNGHKLKDAELVAVGVLSYLEIMSSKSK